MKHSIACFLLLAASFNAGCQDDADTTIVLTVGNEARELQNASSQIVARDQALRLSLVADGLDLSLDLAPHLVGKLTLGQTYRVQGSAGETAQDWVPGVGNAPFVMSVQVVGLCADCASVELDGDLIIESSGDILAGTLTLATTPSSTSESTQVQATFAAEIPNYEVPQPAAVTPAPKSTDQQQRKVVTLKPEQGVNFATGQVIDPGNFKNSDLYATYGHTYLKITPGGDKSTVSNPVLWQGPVNSFDQITFNVPVDGKGYSLAQARSGEAFVLKNHLSDGYTRGWIIAGDDTVVTIEYELLK